ncbi:MAG: TonB-dependent receptor plug domain-containing protein, partial [Alteriqipengyuania sp.]
MTKAGLCNRAILATGVAILAVSTPTIAAAQSADDGGEVEETRPQEPRSVIVVTAQKRTQALDEVPQSISVVGGDTLERQQADSFTDYVELVPSLSLTQSNPGETRVILRGVNTGSVGSTVAIYVDETPFGSSTSLGNAAVLAGDFDTFDLERVEVLRGPQGTLYGSNALGGVIRFVTTPPQLGEFEGRAQAGIETVDGGGVGYLANGVVNVPLGDALAVRASGFYRKKAGFIDAIGRAPEEEIDEAEIYGGRISALFEPTPEFSARLTALAQNIRAGSPSSYDADPVTGDSITVAPNTNTPVSGLVRTEFYPEDNDVEYRLYNGTLEYDFGPVSLTSVTSYGELDQRQRTDNTIGFGSTVTFVYQSFGGRTDDVGVFLDAPLKQEKFTQEVRLASADGPFEWQIGGYF